MNGNKISYEWCCEYVDENGDIQESDWSYAKCYVWPPRYEFDDCKPRLAYVRFSGNEESGENERGYAYEGDECFSSGHKVPKTTSFK